MVRFAVLLLAACSASPRADAGPLDAGGPDAGQRPQEHCVASSCDVSGSWQLVFTPTGPPPPVFCRPAADQLAFTSNGATLCMPRAVDGGSDGGCGFSFVVVTANDSGIVFTDTWSLYQTDAGHLYGTWSTQATGAATCTGVFDVHGVQ